MAPFEKAVRLIKDTVESRRLPSAALGIGIGDTVCVKETFGATSVTPEGIPVREDTLYDMASVSKILSTSMIALRFIAEGILDLADMLPRYFGQDAVPEDKKEISLFHLLTHTSGYPAHIPLYEKIPTPDLTVPYLLSVPLEHAPGTRVVYSCMGFILLGKMLERISGKTLDVLAREEVFSPLGMTRTGYHPLDAGTDYSANTAYTERNPLTGEWLIGQVHDENARFLNGVSGNAGVFSNLNDSIRFARMLAGHGVLDGKTYLPRRIFDVSIQNHTPGLEENRGLGFQLAGGWHSCSGQFFPQTGFGHNGFTGPHIFVDPGSGLWTVLLLNRVHPTRENAEHLRVRRILHTLIAIGLEERSLPPGPLSPS
ncbi:serine hydrolase [uncultured Acetatifactor sp.]|uniref:serine hydrolase domain-containing protein n=1 Tax=uncultured Acetatifactor sp. TaxID=1671927 RepID=UPI00262FB1C4|nr:serine hydrolase domain-containing protein [uncultured Acetatifactor sp.]